MHVQDSFDPHKIFTEIKFYSKIACLQIVEVYEDNLNCVLCTHCKGCSKLLREYFHRREANLDLKTAHIILVIESLVL